MNKIPVVYILGDGLVGAMIREALQDTAEYMVVSDKYITPRIRIESKDPLDDVKKLLHAMNDKFGPPRVIINTLGIIGKPNVDWCEDHKDETFYGNVLIPEALATICAKTETPLIHISTGCVFDSVKKLDTDNYTIFGTDDTPNFEKSYYSYTKAEAERRLHKMFYDGTPGAQIEIHRIRMPFMKKSDPRNLIDKLIKYDTLVDFPNSMTCLEDYVGFVVNRVGGILLEKATDRASGHLYVRFYNVFHAVNKNPIKHSEIVEMMKGHDIAVGEKKYITPAQLDAMCKTPRSNAVLSDEELPDIRVSLNQTLKAYGKE